MDELSELLILQCHRFSRTPLPPHDNNKAWSLLISLFFFFFFAPLGSQGFAPGSQYGV